MEGHAPLALPAVVRGLLTVRQSGGSRRINDGLILTFSAPSGASRGARVTMIRGRCGSQRGRLLVSGEGQAVIAIEARATNDRKHGVIYPRRHSGFSGSTAGRF